MEDKTILPKFDGSDFCVWKAQVQSYLQARNIEIVILQTKPRHQSAETPEAKLVKDEEIKRFEQADRVVKSKILLALDNKQAKHVLSLTTAKQIWDRLVSMHAQKSSASKISLQQEFFDLRMRREENVHDYVGRAEYLHGQLQDIGVTIDEGVLVGKILSGLPRRFHSFISVFMNQQGQTMTDLVARLSAEEHVQERYRKPVEAYYGESSIHENKNKHSRSTNKPHGKNKSNHKTGARGQKDNNQQNKQDNVVRCWKCKKEGHVKKDCPDLRSTNKNGSDSGNNNNHSEPHSDNVMVAEEACLSVAENLWILDSGATSHMTHNARDFNTYSELQIKRVVRFGGRECGYAIGIGNVKVLSKVNGTTKQITLQGVLHVPELRRRLISLSTVFGHKCSGEMSSYRAILKNQLGEAVIIAPQVNGLFCAELEINGSEALLSKEENLTLWHERFGHVNKGYLIKTAEFVTGLQDIKGLTLTATSVRDSIDCVSCCLGKQHKTHVPRSLTNRATEVGERLHVDIGGPVGGKSLSGCEYYILFKDEHTTFRFVYEMRSRSEAYECLRKVIAAVKADTKSAVRYVKSDNGSEFTSNRAQDLFLQNNIVHQVVAPHTPASNGYIERDNRTLMSGVRSMLRHRNLPSKFWGEAASCFVYLLNRSANRDIKKTPYELYFNKKPSVEHLKVFGSLAMVKIQDKKRSGYQQKLEARAVKCVFLGYDDHYPLFTYKIFNPESNKIEFTRNVKFDENKSIYEDPQDYSDLDQFFEQQEDDDDELVVNDDDDECLNVVATHQDEPLTYSEAIRRDDAESWIAAMHEELASMKKNQTWDLTVLPPGRTAVKSKWVFKLKLKASGEVERYKARLVACGYSQKAGIDYKETFSPVVRMVSIRLLLILSNQYNLEMLQLDVKTAFLYGELEEDIYMHQAEGFKKGENLVCKLKRSIYGLKQASLQWNRCFTNFLRKFSLRPLKSDSCVFVNESCDISQPDTPILIVAVYVDDGLVLSNKPVLMEECIEHLKTKFEIKVGQPNMFVGLQIKRDKPNNKIYIHQESYIRRFLAQYELENANIVETPMCSNLKLEKSGANGVVSKLVDVPYRQVLGKLLYASTGSRPDITFSVNLLARFSEQPTLVHWNALKRVVKYLVSREKMAIVCNKQSHLTLHCFTDADFAGCLTTRKSTSGYIVFLNNTPLIWRATRQNTVETSTCAAEFVSAATATKDVIWTRNFLSEIGFRNMTPTPMYIDNQGCITLIQNDQVHEKTKHLDVQLHFVRDSNRKQIKVSYVPTEKQLADILTKALPRETFNRLVKGIGLEILEEVNCVESNMKYCSVLCCAGLLSTLTNVNSFLIGPKFMVQPRTEVISFNHMCDVFRDDETNKELIEISKVFQDEMKSKQQLICRSSRAEMFEYCVLRSAKLEQYFNRFPEVTNRLTKRSIMDEIYKNALELPRIIGAGATIFLKGLSSRTVAQSAVATASSLLIELLGKAKVAFDNKTIVPMEIMKGDIADVSIFAKERMNLLDKAVNERSYTRTYAAYADDEISAAEVLLSSIYLMLKDGKVDTQALGELIESKELMDIDPALTKVREVFLDKTKKTVQIFFDVVKELTLFGRIIWMDVIICGASGIGSILVTLGVCIYVKAMKKINSTMPSLNERVVISRLLTQMSNQSPSAPEATVVCSGGSIGEAASMRSFGTSYAPLGDAGEFPNTV